MYPLHHVSLEYTHKERKQKRESTDRMGWPMMIYCLLSICLASVIPTLRQFNVFSTLQTMIGTNFNGQPISTVFFWCFDAGQPDGIVQWTKNIYTYFFPSKRCWQKRGGNSWKWISKSLQVFLLVCMCPSLCVISRQTCVKYKREKKFRQRVKFSVQSFDHSLFSCS